MSTQIVPFDFNQQQVRVVSIDGEPWFVLADLCKVLDIANVGNTAARLDDDVKGVHSADTLGGRQQMTIVSEAGMYEVVLLSRKPDARAFKKWITGTVLPEIRKTGSYGAPKALTEDQIVFQALTILKTKNEELEAKIVADAPKVAYVDTFVADNDLALIRDVAKNLGMTESYMRNDLIARGWIYKQHSTRWSEKEQKKVPQTRYSAYSHKARYFRHVPNHEAPRFRDETMHTLKVTPAGAAALARLYKNGQGDDLDGLEVADAREAA